jgi:tetratricopeptide (TPR) repeat protein
VSVNDVVTAAVALAAVVVSVVGLLINNIIGKRAARSSLTDLSIKIHDKAAKYKKADASQQYSRAQELEVLLRQADFLMKQVGNNYPEAICIVFAQTLEMISDYWWADKYWKAATHSDDPYYRAMTTCYWALALIDRGQRKLAQRKAEEAIRDLTIDSTDAYIVRGDIMRLMGKWGAGNSWFTRAKDQYEKIPEDDGRHTSYLDCLAKEKRETEASQRAQAARAEEHEQRVDTAQPKPAIATGGDQ